MDYRVANTIEVLNRATNAIWYEMPEEVRRLTTRRGTKGYGWPMIICAEENTRAFADDMAVLRNAGRDQSLDLETLSLDSTIIKLHADGSGALRKRGARRSDGHAAV